MKLFLLPLLFCLSSCSPQSPDAGVEKGAEVQIDLASPSVVPDGCGGEKRNRKEGYVLKVSKVGILLEEFGTETFIPWSSVTSVRIITPAPR